MQALHTPVLKYRATVLRVTNQLGIHPTELYLITNTDCDCMSGLYITLNYITFQWEMLTSFMSTQETMRVKNAKKLAKKEGKRSEPLQKKNP